MTTTNKFNLRAWYNELEPLIDNVQSTQDRFVKIVNKIERSGCDEMILAALQNMNDEFDKAIKSLENAKDYYLPIQI